MNRPVFYDTHAHLDYPDFAGDLDDLIRRAAEAGITRIISIGTDLESSRKAIALSERFRGVYAAVGWHPTDAHRAPADLRPELSDLARHPKVVAIGETGLDYYHLPGKQPGGTVEEDVRHKARQSEIFRQQLEVAVHAGLNCIIHQRESLDDTVSILSEFAGRTRGVFHCFSGDAKARRRVEAFGAMVSFTGIVTFKNAQSVRDALADAPPNGFMLETDCPFLAPVPHRGKRCEPAYVREIAEVVAATRGCTLAELSAATCATAHEFFPKLAGAC